MASFKGTYQHTMDGKGRLFVPAKLRYELGDSFVITRDLEERLLMYTQAEWQVLSDKIDELPAEDRELFQRLLIASGQDCEADAQGRIVIPAGLRAFAGLHKNVTILGMGNRVEIWDGQRLAAQLGQTTAQDIERAKKLLKL